jgi:signal transduction histidine kinase
VRQAPDSGDPGNASTLTLPLTSGRRAGADALSWSIAAAAGVGVSAFAVTVTAVGGLAAHPWLAATGRGVIVAVPIAIGLYAWYRPPYVRFGRMLVAVGVGWSITALAGSSDAVLYSVGRVVAWIVEVGLVYVILAFPYGRLTGRWDRALVAAAGLVLILGYLPTALLADRYPIPSPWTECHAECPANAFQVVDAQPELVGHGLASAREALTILVFLGVAVVLAKRVRNATRLTRLTLTPVLAVAAARLVVYAVAIAVRRASPGAAAVDVLAWMLALLVPVMAMGFLVGLLRWRMFAAGALQRLGQELRAHPDAEGVRAALAEALGDPSLRLGYWQHEGAGAWMDAAGEPLDLDAIGPRSCVAEVYDGEEPVAAIIHDEALRDQPELIAAVATFATLALDNQRLVDEVATSLGEVRESRARIQASADEERRRIERDLHDGAQQRLVGLRIKLELAEEMMPQDPERGRELLHEVGDDTIEALEDVRSLAHGVYPALLTQRGLVEALHEVTLRSPIPTSLLLTGDIGRYPPDVESTVYFCCLEAMQNAAKHAAGASLITIALSDDGALRFEVGDDGAGFDRRTTSPGAGLANMRDRLAAVGGELEVISDAGKGTRVVGLVPGHPA